MDPNDQSKNAIVQQSQALPALASFFIPGLGQLVQGRLGHAIGVFLTVCVLWIVAFALVLIVPPFGILVGPAGNVWAALEASRWAP